MSHICSHLKSKRALRCGGVQRSESCRICVLGAYPPCLPCELCLMYGSCVTCGSCLTCVVAEHSIVRALPAIEREKERERERETVCITKRYRLVM